MDEFSFPYQPYAIQLALMREIRKCLNDSKIGIFESPTGTGKSLSVICSSLNWLENFELKQRSELEKQIKDADEKAKENDDGDDWVAAYKKKFDAKRELSGVEEKLEELKKIDERLKKARTEKSDRKRRNATENKIDGDNEEIFARNTVEEDDPDKDIAPDENYSSDNEVLSSENIQQPSCTKIFYASRTHSQLEQFAAEILKTRYRPRIVTIGSRQILCVNDSVKSLKQTNLMNEKCDELRQKKSGGSGEKRQKRDDSKANKRSTQCSTCQYWRADPIEELTDQILSVKVPTVSKVIQSGKALLACPYFASRGAIALSQIVLLPYQVLLQKATREAWGVNLKDNIVIIDEAHNLLQTIANCHSVELSLPAITIALSLIRDYIERYRSRLKAKNLLYIRQLLQLTTSLNHLLSTYSKNQSDLVFTMSHFLVELDCFEIDFFKLLRYMELTRLCKKFHGFYVRYRGNSLKCSAAAQQESISGKRLAGIQNFLRKIEKSSEQEPIETDEEASKQSTDSKQGDDANSSTTTVSSPLYLLKQFIEALTTKCSDARIIIEMANAEHPLRLKFMLLNPSDKLKDVIKLSRSVVLIGGTMEPAHQLLHSIETLCEVPSECIMRFSCGHVIDDNQLIALSLSRGPAGQDLSLTYANRALPTTLSALSMSLMNILRHVPNGVVAFFPSYEYMSAFSKSLKSTPLFEKFNKLKTLFFESKRADSTTLWNDFVRKAQTPQGAMLCAVVGGKLSEGINFSDELGRCVIMIGLPYPNKNSVELNEKMKYLDATLGAGSGSEHYETSCLHAVNQAIGRAIRHRNDYAAIILIDSRYSKPNIEKGLPTWISSRLKHCKNFGELITQLSTFFKMRKQLSLST